MEISLGEIHTYGDNLFLSKLKNGVYNETSAKYISMRIF